MTTRTWIRRLFDRRPRTIRKDRVRFRPRLEWLEKRLAPTVSILGLEFFLGSPGGIDPAAAAATRCHPAALKLDSRSASPRRCLTIQSPAGTRAANAPIP
jgi:hypothetical protein